MLTLEGLRRLTDPNTPLEDASEVLLGFDVLNVSHFAKRLRMLAPADVPRAEWEPCFLRFLTHLHDAPAPDASLMNFERFLQASNDANASWRFLASHPRALEILLKLFVGSQHLTQALVREPPLLKELTQHKQLADLKSREEFLAPLLEAGQRDGAAGMRRVHTWEMLRIAACDVFGLLDFRSVTLQLSLLADASVEACLRQIVPRGLAGFVVLGFGKLGGEELNYSSDIDLVFLAEPETPDAISIGQKLIRSLQDAASEGWFYRVDMRLRPWGRSGPLVCSPAAFHDYVRNHAQPWERQALIKARVVAGDRERGARAVQQARSLIFETPAAVRQQSVLAAKQKIEDRLRKEGRLWGEVKSGAGSIRDVEFVVQYLQWMHGEQVPYLSCTGTLDALVRLADCGLLHADEYRVMTDGYIFLRTIEHALQLMHNVQTHSLPSDPHELEYLARRLDFRDGEQLLRYYQRHSAAVRDVFDRRLTGTCVDNPAEVVPAELFSSPVSDALPEYRSLFSAEEIALHRDVLGKVNSAHPARVLTEQLPDGMWRVTVLGIDQPGDLSMICGLLFVYGFDIVRGDVLTDCHPGIFGAAGQAGQRRDALESTEASARKRGAAGRKSRSGAQSARESAGAASGEPRGKASRDFIDVFSVKAPYDVVTDVWVRYQMDLQELKILGATGRPGDAQGRLARRVAAALQDGPARADRLAPVEILFDNDSHPQATLLEIRAPDSVGFLYELTNGLALCGLNVEQMTVRTEGRDARDVLLVTEASNGQKLSNERRQREIRAAVVLIKHFTHLLPKSPNAEAALTHFRQLVQDFFQQPDCWDQLTSLERPEVLDALAQLLGVSDFLWEDFLRVQHAQLFPVVADVHGLALPKTRAELTDALDRELKDSPDFNTARERLNSFKDRKLFRIDMRHILGKISEFGDFSSELTDLAEVVVRGALSLGAKRLAERYGQPTLESAVPCRWCAAAMGKFGGRELGFASDIELLFVYEGDGSTRGRESISNAQYFQKFVELFMQTLLAKEDGIFRVDLRLRPYGRAGSLANSLAAITAYYGPNGPSWPYEDQSLVKLRLVAGNFDFGQHVVDARDQLIFLDEPFDFASMRALRERQIRQLVRPGVFHAKLSPGGLVDAEYLVQAMQIRFGRRARELRTTNTTEALAALGRLGLAPRDDVDRLMEAYQLLRRLIDALRMVRGNAKDLAVPAVDSAEFEFLTRRLARCLSDRSLTTELERCSQAVLEIQRRWEQLAAR